MSGRSAIVLPNQLTELERVAREIEAFGEAHGIAPNLIFHVKVALDEILTNVISYGYPEGGEHMITVRLALKAAELVIEVEDDGRPFNPLTVAPPDLEESPEERPIGGLGLHLVRKMMDRLEYRREQDKNLLVMIKALR
jgi:serine/threonine-protein kinase RsbW